MTALTFTPETADERTVWGHMQDQHHFTKAEVAQKSNMTRHQFQYLWSRLLYADAIRMLSRQGHTCYYTAKDIAGLAKVIADKRLTPEASYWQAMRSLMSFTPGELLMGLGESAESDQGPKVRSYCSALMRAGYLNVLQKAVPGVREARYRLIRNTGPLPPVEKRLRAVVDQNDDRVVYAAGERL